MPTVIFDLDGTLSSSHSMALIAIQKTAESWNDKFSVNIKLPGLEDVKKALGLPEHEYFKELVALESKSDLERFRLDCRQTEIDLLHQGHAPLFDGVRELLEYLDAKGFLLALATNASREYAEANLGHHDLISLFSLTYTISDSGIQNKTDMVRKITRELPPPHVMVGDKSNDIIAGKAGGCWTIGCRYGYGSYTETKIADFEVESAQDLLEILDDLLAKKTNTLEN